MTEHNHRPADPQRDFARLAELFSSFETSPSTEEGLLAWYRNKIEGRYPLEVAVDEADRPVGLTCLERQGDPADGILYVYVIVEAGWRGRGLGSRLYAHSEAAARDLGAVKLYAGVRDNDPRSLSFALTRGFSQRAHGVEMQLDMDHFDDRRFDPLIERLGSEGFLFTSMAELGDTLETRRKLYALNSTAAMTTPGSDGRNPWKDFEDFNASVCEQDWYLPAGQIVAVDRHTGAWAGMSAISRMAGANHAYNLFTGVEMSYRGRGLGTAVKVLALRFARTRLDAHQVLTNHNALNAPMIAIDLKLGYTYRPGLHSLVKEMRD